nr:Beige protein-like 1 [Exophiala xenobiotica]
MGLTVQTHGRGRAVSTADILRPQDKDIAALVKNLDSLDCTSFEKLQNSLEQSAPLQQLRHFLKDDAELHGAKSGFRRAGGLQALLRLLRSLTDTYGAQEDAATIKPFLQTLSQWFAVLGAALEDHEGSQRYFRTKVDDDGWRSLQCTLQQCLTILSRQSTDELYVEQFFGILLATAAGVEVVDDLYTAAEKSISTQISQPLSEDASNIVRIAVTKSMSSVDEIALPEMLTTMLLLWSAGIKADAIPQRSLRLVLPVSLKEILSISRHNLVAAHTAGTLTAILQLVFEERLSQVERTLFKEAALVLCQEGVSSLEDAHYLFNQAAARSDAAAFLLDAVQASRQPPSVQFDLSQQGYASTELATLGRPFPPLDTAGYTLSLWVRFDSYDSQAHTTLFGAFDKTQACFILAYLEKDTHHLILQTAIQGSRPSVRFKSVAFQPDQWYHICIVHKRPRTTSSSRASLFVDGNFVEQQKANYPTVPPNERGQSTPKIQAFFGTPQDLSPRSAGTSCLSKWSLGSAVLFSDALSDDLVAVFYHLGPKYHGNFQDCLGSFQTYQASAALNLRNEMLHPGKEDHSELILAIRRKASNLIREDRILINVSPAAILDNDDRNNIDETQLVKSLSKLAAKNLVAYTRSGTSAVAINGAVPAINDALTQARGVFLLMGDPTVTVPHSLDDASWRLGGCGAVGLGLVQRARTTEEVALAVDILLETVRHSWRNSEVMERDGGYAILAMLLKEKLVLPAQSNGETGKTAIAIPTPRLDRNALSLRVLQSILSFTGYDHETQSKSVINNPLAYKVLIADSSLWRCGPLPAQQLYFEQFLVFAERSEFKRFNLKRLSRMRVLKRLMEALKSEPVSKATMPMYMAAFKVLLPQSMSAETLRSFALFITFSVNKRNFGLQFRKPTRREVRQRSSSAGSSKSGKEEGSSTLTHFEIGVEMLRLYSDLLCRKDDDTMIKKFAKTVTNKWLLYLLSETSPEVVVLSMRIVSRLLVVHGDTYVKKFKDSTKTSGFTVMAYRLKRWWHLPALWPICFAILFDLDVCNLDLDRNFDLFGFIDLFASKKEFSVVFPEILEVIMAMLQSGLKTIVSPKRHQASTGLAPPLEDFDQPPQRLSMSTMAPPNPLLTIVTSQHIETFDTVVRFLADLHTRSRKFRDFAASSPYVQHLLSVLFPVVVGSDIVEARTELDARDSTLTFDGADVIVRPLSTTSPIIRTTETEIASAAPRGKSLRRGSSFVLVTREQAHQNGNGAQPAHANGSDSAVGKLAELNEGHSIVQSLLEIVVAVFLDQILMRKDFPGLGLFLKTPPGFIEHQTYFETWLLRNTVSQLTNHLALDQKILTEPRVLINLARLFGHLEEALFEGWFIGGADPVLDLSGSILEYLQRPDIAKMKSVRLCAQTIAIIRAVVFRTVLLGLSSIKDDESLPFLEKLTYWQTVLLSAEETQSIHLQLVCYLLYAHLVSSTEAVRQTAANLWRIILVQKPEEAAAILGQTDTNEQKGLATSFAKVVELDNETFLYWVDEHRAELDSLFFDTLSKQWDAFVASENKRTEENGRMRITRRREKVKQWAREEADRDDLIRRHEFAFENWTANIYSSEYLKHQRLLQDQQDDLLYTEAGFSQMQRDTSRPGGLFYAGKARKWRLDQTEGRNRMRMRLHEDFSKAENDQQPKRKGSETPQLRLDTKNTKMSTAEAIGVTPGGITPMVATPKRVDTGTEPFPQIEEEPQNQDPAHEADSTDASEQQGEAVEGDDSFEMVEDPNAEMEDFEDKNRKVMRSLHRGDQVKHVANISRVLGLEAVEGLLILGKDFIYLLDNFFQRADGEIVNVWQAPEEERDPYVRMISGRDVKDRKHISRNEEHGTRSWKWSEIISVSKRRFLFRDVAMEIFFSDGRSYLLTVISPQLRNDLHSLVSAKSPSPTALSAAHPETAWRYETLRSVDDEPQTLGSKFANVFGQQSSYLAATRKWQKGEMSNFHYLMLINTLAGRTYNDLTQYPVFPWVIADYTSDELDLSDPRSFRDLSKPMGCQTPERERQFRERYEALAEMGDSSTPAFHYGTHYSSAMIVTSYLIRLQPFVKSYLLLQGGTFDHPDRMFFSIEGAWKSASRLIPTDVRELTPEFYYLPEFLVNVNDYDFGTRQNSTKSIGSVELPPWAKGDPRIFIARQREALESPHVSKNLHKWIDLIFGCKQKGEAAVEAVNVFHYLSYQGARDLDAITDPRDRLATIGVIHNFGQTPYQVFSKPHPDREHIRHRYKRLDTAAESLTRVPSTLLETEEKVGSLSFSWKSDRLLCSGAFRLNIPPDFEMYMEWGFSDNSVRFYSTETRKQIGLFEHLHIGQLSSALFTDSKTLVTAGTDCTVAVWTVVDSGKSVELHPRATLFGHRKPVSVLAISRSFNALLSASTDGQVMLWDLNRCEFNRMLADALPVTCATINDVTGNIVLCHDHEISVYSLNGDRLLRQDSGDRLQESIISCACYQGAGNEWLERDLVFTGHKRGQVRIWSKVVRGGHFELELIRQLNHADSSRDDGANVNAGISCILPMPQVVYTGDEDGRVVSFFLSPRGDAFNSGNLDFDARVPIPVSVFPSTYRSDAQASTETTVTKVEADLQQPSRVGREDTRFSREEIDITTGESNRPRREQTTQREDLRIYEERDRRHPEIELTREKYRGPAEYTRNVNVDLDIDRQQQQPYDTRAFETQLDITERDYRRRLDPNYDIEYERRRPVQADGDADITVQKEQVTTTETRDKMGYYDDEGEYHSFRRGVERAADRVLHPFSHGHHHHGDRVEREEVVITERDSGPSGAGPVRVRDGAVEQVRYVEPRFGSKGVPIQCHFIRVGDILLLQGRPSQVIRISMSSQTGQYRYLGVDLFTRQLHEESSFISNPAPSVVVQTMLGPVFKQYRVLDIREDGLIVAMTETGDVKQGLPVVDQGGLFRRVERAFGEGRGSVRVLVINDGGRELVVDMKIIHGSRL